MYEKDIIITLYRLYARYRSSWNNCGLRSSPVVVGVGNNDVVLRVDGDAARLGELPLHDAKLAKLAVVNHLLALDVALGREDGRVDELGRELENGVGRLRQRGRAVGEGLKQVVVAAVGRAVGPLFVRVPAAAAVDGPVRASVQQRVAERRRERAPAHAAAVALLLERQPRVER